MCPPDGVERVRQLLSPLELPTSALWLLVLAASFSAASRRARHKRLGRGPFLVGAFEVLDVDWVLSSGSGSQLLGYPESLREPETRLEPESRLVDHREEPESRL